MAELDTKYLTIDTDDLAKLQQYYDDIQSGFVIDIDEPSQPIYTAVMAASEAAVSINAKNSNYKATAEPVNTFISNVLRLISGLIRASIDKKTGEQITGAAIGFANIGGSKYPFVSAKACYDLYHDHIENYLTKTAPYSDTFLIPDEATAKKGEIRVWTDKDGNPIKGQVDEEGTAILDEDGQIITTDSGDYIIRPLGYQTAPYIDEDTGEQIGLLVAWGQMGIKENLDDPDTDFLYATVNIDDALKELQKKYPGAYSIKYYSEEAADKTKDALDTAVIINGGDPKIKNLYQSIGKLIKTYAERGKTGGAFAYADFAWGVQSQQQMYEIYHSYDDDKGGNAIWRELEDKGYLVKYYQSQYPPYEEYGLKIAWGANDLDKPDLNLENPPDDKEYESDYITKEEAMELLDVVTPQHAVDTEEQKNIVAPRAEDLIETAFSGTEALSVTLNNLIGETIESTIVNLKNNIIEKDLPYVIVDTTKSTNAALSAFILGKQTYTIKHQALELYKDETYSDQSVKPYPIDTPITLPKIMDDLGYIAYKDKEKTQPFYLTIDDEEKYVVFGYYDQNAIIDKLMEEYLKTHENATEEEVNEYVESLTEDETKLQELWEKYIELILLPLVEELQEEIDEATVETSQSNITYYKAADGTDVLEINVTDWGIANYIDSIEGYIADDKLQYWEDFFKFVNKKLKSVMKSKQKQIKKKKITNVNQTTILKIPFSSIRGGGDNIAGVADTFARRNYLSKDVQLNGENNRYFYYVGDADQENNAGRGASIMQALSNLGWNLIWRQGYCNYTDLRSSLGAPVWDTRYGLDVVEGINQEYDANIAAMEGINDLWKWDKEVYYKFELDKEGKEQRAYKGANNTPGLGPEEKLVNGDKITMIEAVTEGVAISEDAKEKTKFPHSPLYDVKLIRNANNSKYIAFYADPHPIYSFYWTKKNKINDLKPPAYGTNCDERLLSPVLTAKEKKSLDKNFFLKKDQGPGIYGVIDPNEDPYNANAAMAYGYAVKASATTSTSSTMSTTATETEAHSIILGANGLQHTYVTLPYEDISSADGIIVAFSDYTSQLYPSETIVRYVMETEWEYDLQDGKAVDGYYNTDSTHWTTKDLDEAKAFNKKQNTAYWTYVHSAIKNIKGQKVKPSSPNVLQTLFNALQEQVAKAEGVKNPTKY